MWTLDLRPLLGRRTRLAAALAVATVIVFSPVFDCPAPVHARGGSGCATCRDGGSVTGWEYLRFEAGRGRVDRAPIA